jgi:hypothetical protein
MIIDSSTVVEANAFGFSQKRIKEEMFFLPVLQENTSPEQNLKMVVHKTDPSLKLEMEGVLNPEPKGDLQDYAATD